MCGQADLELTFSAFGLLKLRAGTIVPDVGDEWELPIKTRGGDTGRSGGSAFIPSTQNVEAAGTLV